MKLLSLHSMLGALLGLIGFLSPAQAGLPVVDGTHIAVSQTNAAIDLAEQIAHELNQIRQIHGLVQQIAQMDENLRRLGDPGLITELEGIHELLEDLAQAPEGKTSAKLVEEITGRAALEYDGLGVFEPIKNEMVAADNRRQERDPARYRAEEASQRSFENYRRVQENVLERRATLKEAVSNTSAQLQRASTSSEVAKLTGVMMGLQTELEALDRELEFAALESLTRALENENQESLIRKAAREEDVYQFKEATRADADRFRLFTEPTPFRR